MTSLWIDVLSGLQAPSNSIATLFMKDCASTTKSTPSLSDEPHERKARQYRKLTLAAKKELVELIIRHNFSIRKAAERLNVNYSSAKIILNKYKLKQRLSFISEGQPTVAAQIRDLSLEEGRGRPITLVSLVGGRYQSQNSAILKLIQRPFI